MKSYFKRLSLLLVFILTVELTGQHTTIKAEDPYSAMRGDYTGWLCYGIDNLQTPLASFNDVKNVPILDIKKLEAAKGKYWYDCRPGSNGFSYKTIVEEDKYELQRKTALELEVGYKSPALGLSTKLSKIHEETTVDNRCFGEVVARCLKEKYTLALDPYELRKYVSDDFVKAVKKGDYESVFQHYGTHLISESFIGGELKVSFHSKDTSKKTKDELKVLAEESYKGLTAKQGYTSSTETSEFKKNCAYSFSANGGDLDVMPAQFDQNDNYKEWAKSVQNKPAMYQVNNCIPIWELFEDKTIQGNLKVAYYKYFNKYLEEQKKNVSFVTNMRVAVRGDAKIENELRKDEIVTKTDASLGYINSDLNRKAGGKFIYLLYLLGNDQSKKITDVITNNASKTDAPAKAGYIHLPEDLNKGAGGKFIYIDYKRENNPALSGYQGFCTRNSSNYCYDNWEPIKDKYGKIIDLNEGAGGDFIYLFGYKDPIFTKIDNQIKENNKEIAKIIPTKAPATSSPVTTSKPVVTSTPKASVKPSITLSPVKTLKPIGSMIPIKSFKPVF